MRLIDTLAGTKDPQFETKSKLTISQIARLKDAIRYTNFGNFSTLNALKYINSGILGHKEVKNKEPEPIKISRATYFRYKDEALDPEEIQREINEFMKSGYVIDMMSIRAVLKEFFAMMEQNIYNAETPRDKQFIINSMITRLPLYAQYLEVLRVLADKGKLKVIPHGEEQVHRAVA